ncbi:flagellar export chaperone FliS [Butyrivibrio sp. VCD2006]|uniref:flagellar export chaperone FliS n=1 Tax=Butyrivibrio sp. VCD2006 TaxID=1280664 RepID=UPI000425C4E4|nr:flagellar protein FliS [Butyrivibrio sp. VCD2006]
MTKEKIRGYTRRITMANKTQMITILYEMVLDYICEAEDSLELQDEKGFTNSLSRATSCIDELIHSLNIKYELGKNLLALYLFEKKQIIKASARISSEELIHVKKTFERLHEAYLQLETKNNEEALMMNVPKVYAGLTYGKGRLEESIAENFMSRGYMA